MICRNSIAAALAVGAVVGIASCGSASSVQLQKLSQADTYSLVQVGDETIVYGIDVGGASAVPTATGTPDGGDAVIASSVAGTWDGGGMLSLTDREGSTSFLSLSDDGTTVRDVGVDFDTGLAAATPRWLVTLQPAGASGDGGASLLISSLEDPDASPRRVDIDFAPRWLSVEGDVVVAAGWERGVLSTWWWDTVGGAQATASSSSPEPVDVSVDGGRPIALVTGHAVEEPFQDGLKAADPELRRVGEQASVADVSGDWVTYDDGYDGGLPVLVVENAASGERHTLQGLGDEALLGLHVTEDGHVAALYPSSIVFGPTDGTQAVEAELQGDVLSTW